MWLCFVVGINGGLNPINLSLTFSSFSTENHVLFIQNNQKYLYWNLQLLCQISIPLHLARDPNHLITFIWCLWNKIAVISVYFSWQLMDAYPCIRFSCLGSLHLAHRMFCLSKYIRLVTMQLTVQLVHRML